VGRPITTPEISGVSIAPLVEIKDDRGAVLHMLRSDSHGFTGFGECYFSEILPGAIKAWKRHRIQTQRLAVPIGRIRIAVFDSRELSPTNGALLVLELGRPDAYLRLEIPPAVWYGFACVSGIPALVANCTDLPHDPEESERRPVGDSTIPFVWDETG
jgi:dTDP-4-dehydrorhamnose 3,5-epimerase